MQINATTSIQAITPAERLSSGVQAHAKAQEIAATVKAVDQAAPAPKVFTPAPPLRPNVQDYVDIDRTLIALRQGT